MIRRDINIKELLPMKRQTAAEIATLASRFECTFTLEARNVILNAKSMLGLLSMALPDDGQITVNDEEAAIQGLIDLLRKLGV